MENKDTIINNLITELRRGTLVISVLSQLNEKHYGYSLLQLLNDKGVDVEQNTLYPLLRRLEQQGLLTSDWDTESNRPRKYYILNDNGKKILSEVVNEWDLVTNNVNNLLINIREV